MEHSKTPWKVNICDRAGIWIAAADLRYVAKTMHEANASRIVACVNACEGIETEALEDAHILIQAASKNMAAAILAEKQRDQLAEALEGMLQIYGGALDYDYLPKSSVEMDCIDQARAALAAVKGE